MQDKIHSTEEESTEDYIIVDDSIWEKAENESKERLKEILRKEGYTEAEINEIFRNTK